MNFKDYINMANWAVGINEGYSLNEAKLPKIDITGNGVIEVNGKMIKPGALSTVDPEIRKQILYTIAVKLGGDREEYTRITHGETQYGKPTTSEVKVKGSWIKLADIPKMSDDHVLHWIAVMLPEIPGAVLKSKPQTKSPDGRGGFE